MKPLRDIPERQLLYARKQAAHLLGTSISTVIRLEKSGKLTPVKLTGSEQSATYYRAADLERVADGSKT